MNKSPFGKLEALRTRPIPDQAGPRVTRKGYRQHALDLSLPQAGEKLVAADSIGLAGVNHYFSPANPPYYQHIPGAVPELFVRESVGQKLTEVNSRLRPSGLELFLFDAWRPRAVQAYFHDHWMPAKLREQFPDLTADDLIEHVELYWAAPTSGDASPAPHSTGGAVDLTLRWIQTSEHLWMGSLFDDVSEIAHLDHFELERPAGLAFSAEEARANRRLLYWVMTEAGFAQNPSEWWHYGYGDLMWARLTGAAASFYGAIESPPGR